jgi:hypothetical protein
MCRNAEQHDVAVTSLPGDGWTLVGTPLNTQYCDLFSTYSAEMWTVVFLCSMLCHRTVIRLFPWAVKLCTVVQYTHKTTLCTAFTSVQASFCSHCVLSAMTSNTWSMLILMSCSYCQMPSVLVTVKCVRSGCQQLVSMLLRLYKPLLYYK